MTTQRKALKLALELYQHNERHYTLAETRYWCDQYKLLAKTAIEALAQPEQEPHGLAAYVIGCFRAAEVEGLQEALAETTDERLKDLVERRFMYALYEAQNTPQPPEQPSYKDSTPHLSVGESSFESWFSEYHITNDMIKPKQVARDAYAAGMGDPLVAPAVQPLTYEQRKQMWHKANPAHRAWASFDWYSQGVADTEAAHGIKKQELK